MTKRDAMLFYMAVPEAVMCQACGVQQRGSSQASCSHTSPNISESIWHIQQF